MGYCAYSVPSGARDLRAILVSARRPPCPARLTPAGGDAYGRETSAAAISASLQWHWERLRYTATAVGHPDERPRHGGQPATAYTNMRTQRRTREPARDTR